MIGLVTRLYAGIPENPSVLGLISHVMSENRKMQAISREVVIDPSETTRRGLDFLSMICYYVGNVFDKKEIKWDGQETTALASNASQNRESISLAGCVQSVILNGGKSRRETSAGSKGKRESGMKRISEEPIGRSCGESKNITAEIEARFLSGMNGDARSAERETRLSFITLTIPEETINREITLQKCSSLFADHATLPTIQDSRNGQGNTINAKAAEPRIESIMRTAYARNAISSGNVKARYSPNLQATVGGKRKRLARRMINPQVTECEKAFAGQGGGEQDGGTGSRVFGAFLTWMQERKPGIFIIATSNDISKLPPEFLRAGRWDEMWFVDLPTTSERVEIAKVMAQKYEACSKVDPKEVAQATEGSTGAEIEQAYVDALYAAFDRSSKAKTGDVLDAIKCRVPLSTTMREKIDALRKWAKGRARIASAQDSNVTATGRTIE